MSKRKYKYVIMLENGRFLKRVNNSKFLKHVDDLDDATLFSKLQALRAADNYVASKSSNIKPWVLLKVSFTLNLKEAIPFL